MTTITEVTFERLGVTFTEPTYWVNENQPLNLAKLLAHFLVPDVGEAWILSPELGWVGIREDNWEKVTKVLEGLVEIWGKGQDGHDGFSDFLTEDGRCTIFMDAERFRSCVPKEMDFPEEPHRFYVGFEVDWSFVDVSCLTPHLRVTNYWPSVERWAPPGPATGPEAPLSAEAAATVLEDFLWQEVIRTFRFIREAHGLPALSMDVGHGDQRPPVFYFATPVPSLEDGASYLQGDHLRALNTLGHRVLASTDMRATEITGGVMEGCLAVFNHCPDPRAEYYLLLPLAGAAEAEIESKIHFLADKLHFIDLDASNDVLGIVSEMEAGRTFTPIWAGSAESGKSLIKLIYSLLPKTSIQDRMYALTHLMSGFLAKLQARAYESALNRDTLRKRFVSFMDSSRNFAERSFTVQPIPGVAFLEIAEGRTRTNKRFAEALARTVEEARDLPDKISQFRESLTYTAALEERKQEREKKRVLEAEEKASKRLNLVLAAVAGLAAIPLIFGQYDVQSLLAGIGDWFPFGLGVQISFLAGLSTLLGIIIVMGLNYLRKDRSLEEPSSLLVGEVSHLSDKLFDCYRSYQHGRMKEAIFRDIQAVAYFREGIWEDASEEERRARELVHKVDRKLAEVAAVGMDRSFEWDEEEALPEDDEAWARDLERKICRFVLLGDVIDLRPENLHLPLSLTLYRNMYRRAGLGSTPVSEKEYEQVMNSFGYNDDEIRAVEGWGAEAGAKGGTAAEFVQACVEKGITALHKERIT